jgi:hypothetical protein
VGEDFSPTHRVGLVRLQDEPRPTRADALCTNASEINQVLSGGAALVLRAEPPLVSRLFGVESLARRVHATNRGAARNRRARDGYARLALCLPTAIIGLVGGARRERPIIWIEPALVLNRAEYEKPRHVFREAGLIIS